MWMMELAANTITAESRIGSKRAVRGTMRSLLESRVECGKFRCEATAERGCGQERRSIQEGPFAKLRQTRAAATETSGRSRLAGAQVTPCSKTEQRRQFVPHADNQDSFSTERTPRGCSPLWLEY